MPQTISAFLAMLLTSLLAINQQRAILHSYEGMLSDAMEVMSSGIALQSLDYISRQAFDDALVGGGSVANPSELADLPFTGGNACLLSGIATTCDDINDYHYMIPDTLDVIVRGGASFKFTVSAEIFYVDQSLNPDSMVTYETYAKMLVVEVEDVSGIMRNPARISRLITCDSSEGCS